MQRLLYPFERAGLDVHAFLDRGRQDVGLERGADLLAGQRQVLVAVDLQAVLRADFLARPVVIGAGPTRPRVQRLDGAAARVLEHRARTHRGRVERAAARVHQRLVVADGLVQGGHLGVVDGGADDVPAVEHLRRAEVVDLLQLALDHLQDIRVPDVASDGLRDVVTGSRELHRVGLLLGQRAHLHHAVEHVVPPVHQLRAVLRQRVGTRLLDDGGDHGGLRRGEAGHRFVVVGLRGRADAVGAVTQVDRVEVVLQDPLLGLLLGHLHGHEDLLDLAADRLLGADAGVVLPDELLGDGRTALQRAVAAPEVRIGGPQDTGRRDAAFVEEVPVLSGENGRDEPLRLLDLGVAEHLAIGGAEPADEGPVLGIDHRLREAGGRHRLGGDRRLLVGHGHRDRTEHDDAADDPEQDAQGLAQRPVPPPAALDLDPGTVEPAASGPTRAAAGTAPPRGDLGRPQVAGGLGLPVQLGGFLSAAMGHRASRWGRPARVAGLPAAPRRMVGIGAHCGADSSALHVAGLAGLAAVREVRIRTAETLCVPAR